MMLRSFPTARLFGIASRPSRAVALQFRLFHSCAPPLSRVARVSRHHAFPESSERSHDSASPRVGDSVASDIGLSRFMGRVHATSAAAFGGSLVVATALTHIMPAGFFASQYPLQTLGVSLVGAIGSLVWFRKARYTVATTYEHAAESGVAATAESTSPSVMRELGATAKAVRAAASAQEGPVVPIYTAVYSDSRKAAFASFLAFETLVLLPMVDMANQINGMLVPGAAGITAMVMGGASLYAYQAKPKHMAAWKAPLAGGLMALLGINLAGLGSLLLMGPNAFAMAVFSAEPYVGIALFTALTASDTYQAMESYKQRDPDHLGVAVELYLNAINLFLRILRLMAEAKKN